MGPVVPAGDDGLLDPRLLRLFDALYSVGSVTQAADSLRISQPTASLQLAALRRALGDPLFVRSPTGMRPTPRADELIAGVRAALDALRRVSTGRTAFSPAATSRRFRIHMSDASTVTLLPTLLKRAREEAPGVRLDAVPIDGHTPAELRSGAGDLALGFVPGLETGFLAQSLYSQDWVCLVGAAHPHVRRSLTRGQFATLGHVTIGQGTGATLLEERLVDAGIRRDAVLTVPGVLGLPAILASSQLVATVPRHVGTVLAHDPRIRLTACPIDVGTFVVRSYWHARFDGDPAHQWLRRLVVDLFGSSSTAGGTGGRGKPTRPWAVAGFV